MAKYRATRNLKHSDGEKHADVKKGELFDVSEEYAEKHLVPHGYVEHPDAQEEREEKEHEEETKKIEKKSAELAEKAEKRRSSKKSSKKD